MPLEKLGRRQAVKTSVFGADIAGSNPAAPVLIVIIRRR